MGTAVAAVWVAVGAAGGVDRPPVVVSLEVRSGPESVAVVLRTDRPIRPPVSAVRTPDGRLQRVYVDFPAGTTVARDVRRVVPGTGAVRRVGIGRTATDVVRVVVDVEGSRAFAVRRLPAGHGVAVVVAAPGAAAPPEAPVPPPQPTAALREAPAPPQNRVPATAPARRLRVVLDPGHGGDDPGATGIVEEKTITLAIARELATLLRSGLDAQVTLTRDTDRSVSLRDRTRLANVAHGDLFVSIHANASPRRAAHGIETYYLDNTEDQATLRLAAIENGRAGAGGRTNLDYILSSLVQGGKQEPSVSLATHVQAGLVGRLRHDWRNVVDLGVKRGPFYVLVGAYMPCVLVEVSFLTNPDEGRRLAEPAYQRAIAEGIYRGIVRFTQAPASVDTL
jgi:N-acetylmuramoyl-L-alanine amidase